MAVLGDGEPLGSAIVDCFAGAGRSVPGIDTPRLRPGPLGREYDVVFLTLEWKHLRNHAQALNEILSGIVLVVCTTSVSSDENGFLMAPVPEGSVTNLAAHLFPKSRVVGALHQFTTEHLTLANLGILESDVPVVGDDREATDLVEELIDELRGLKSVYLGGLGASAAVEGLSAIVNEVSQNRQSPVGFRLNENGAGGLRFLH